MIKSSTSSYESQDRRSLIKNISSKMKNLAIEGAGLNKWEADILIELIEEVYFSESGLQEITAGQVKKHCVSCTEGPGKELKDCQLTTVILNIFGDTDSLELSSPTYKGRSIEMRRRRLMRIASEAKDQGGLLSQEDLSVLLMCDVRTIRRDIQALKAKGIVTTSKLMELKFVPEESTFTYFDATKEYILNHGKPVSFYSDKHSVFRPTQSSSTGKRITQFTRALSELNIDLICADSCEAKGRVERANKTLQDRLIKEMRLRNIATPEEGNKFLPEFIKSYNEKFGKEPACSSDIHREISLTQVC